MKEKKDIKIRYRSGVGVERGKDGFTHKEYEYDFISAATSCTKRFRRAIYILMGIDGCERNLIEWLSEVMTEGNYVSNNELTRRNFIEFYKKHKKKDKKPYTETTVKIAFQRLASSDLLIKQTRGTFMVNPLYYFEGDDESRIRAIKMMMEFKQGTNTTISMEVNKK